MKSQRLRDWEKNCALKKSSRASKTLLRILKEETKGKFIFIYIFQFLRIEILLKKKGAYFYFIKIKTIYERILFYYFRDLKTL